LHWIDGQSEAAIEDLISLADGNYPDAPDLTEDRRLAGEVDGGGFGCVRSTRPANALLAACSEKRRLAAESRILCHTGQIRLHRGSGAS
jgi:hypothetical protein